MRPFLFLYFWWSVPILHSCYNRFHHFKPIKSRDHCHQYPYTTGLPYICPINKLLECCFLNSIVLLAAKIGRITENVSLFKSLFGNEKWICAISDKLITRKKYSHIWYIKENKNIVLLYPVLFWLCKVIYSFIWFAHLLSPHKFHWH